MIADHLYILETLTNIYEDLDLGKVEEKFVDLVFNAFGFDRVGLLFVKHKKGVLQGKLARGPFANEDFLKVTIPTSERHLFLEPLISGIPYLHEGGHTDPVLANLGLDTFALIPIVNKRLVACWQVKNCNTQECPAYGKKWLRCWLVSGTMCHDGADISVVDKCHRCECCPVFLDQDIEALEGVLLVDNSISKEPIGRETLTVLAVIAHAVGRAVDNAKLFQKTLNFAIRDELTGLHNRRYFNERLHDEISSAHRYSQPLSLVLCDIDHFKMVNDSFGHPVGDSVLRMIGDFLRREHRKSDVVARFGGEEFALLLLHTNNRDACQIAEGLRRRFEESRFETGGRDLAVTLSFGVSTLDGSADTLEKLVSRADEALYTAKGMGRNRVICV